MKFIVALSCVLAVATASYIPADTPEVAVAKAQHFAAHNEARARNWAHDAVNGQWVAAAPSWNAVWSARAGSWYAPSWSSWHEPSHISVVNGHVQDTPEVAAEKAKHFALYAEAQARSGAVGGDEGQWVDDTQHEGAVGAVIPVVGHHQYLAAPAVYARHHVSAPANIVVANGHVQDTPEVAVEKAKHFAIVAETRARDAAAGSTEWASNAANWQAWGSPAAVTTYAAVAPIVSGVYPAVRAHYQQPAHVVVANGHVQDTPEVAHEKAKHLAIVAETRARDAVVGSVEWAAPAPAVLTRVAAAPVAVPVAAEVHSQYHAQDEAGQYAYGYNGGLSTKNEEKTIDGVTRGAFSYVDANGLIQSRSYVADAVNGFRVAATDLPHDNPAVAVAPAVSYGSYGSYAAPVVASHAVIASPAAQVLVKPDGTLEDTPEVAAAKAQHFAAHQQEHARHAGW